MKGFQCNSSSEMDKFFCDLEVVLEQYNHDVTALDDYEVASQFVHKQGSALPLDTFYISYILYLCCDALTRFAKRWRSTSSVPSSHHISSNRRPRWSQWSTSMAHLSWWSKVSWWSWRSCWSWWWWWPWSWRWSPSTTSMCSTDLMLAQSHHPSQSGRKVLNMTRIISRKKDGHTACGKVPLEVKKIDSIQS